MKLSFLVSAFNRPAFLSCALWSIKCQTHQDFEVIVIDNAVDDCNRLPVEQVNDERFKRIVMRSMRPELAEDCYWAAEWIAETAATGDYLCFASDDSYYVPLFAEKMITAAGDNDWDLVYCDLLYDPRLTGGVAYSVLSQQPSACQIDKTGFIVRRSIFKGFSGKCPIDVPGGACADGETVQSLVEGGATHGKVPEILAVHN